MRAADYQRVVDDVRRRISSGDWPPGHQLPSRRDMTELYGVGEGTIRDAVATLRQAGEIEGTARRRLRVAHPVVVRTLTDIDAPWPQQGDRWLGRRQAPPGIAERLELAPRTQVYWERTELLDPDGRPSHLLTVWRPTESPDPWASTTADVSLRALSADEARDLGLIAGLPALLVERDRADSAGRPVEAADLVLPADRWRIRLR
jgi:GntR family transcriptional regulator